jgi:hypothetical protein
MFLNNTIVMGMEGKFKEIIAVEVEISICAKSGRDVFDSRTDHRYPGASHF